MANTATNNIQFNVKAVNNQLMHDSAELGSSLAELTKAMQAATDKILKIEKKIPVETKSSNKDSKRADIDSFVNKQSEENKTSSLFGDMKKRFADIRSRISSAFTPLGKLITGAQAKWKAFASSVSASAKTAFAPFKIALNSLFGAALKNGLAALGSAFLSAIAGARQMQTAIRHLKEGFAQMTAPIVQAVAPALASLTDAFATVLAYAGRLFQFLTGKTIKSAEGTAAAVANVGKAAGKTAKKTQEAARSLAGFDEINRLDAPRESAGGAGGGGGGGSAATERTPDWVASSPFLDQVLAAIEAGDWKKAGETVAAKMDSLLKSWDAYAFGKRLGTGVQHALALLSGFIKGAPWTQGEQAMGDGIARLGARNHWNTLGRKLAEGFNGALSALDPADLATVVFAKVNILIRSVGSFLESLDTAALGAKLSAFFSAAWGDLADSIASVDWSEIGTRIMGFFQNLDWAGMAASLGTLLSAMFRSAVDFFAGLLAEPFAFLKEKFLEGFSAICGDKEPWELTGSEIVAGIFAGILKAVAGIGKWIWENLAAPFIDGFCDAFGIHSPSTVAAGWGGAIVAGLCNGLTGAWGQVTAFLDQAVQAFAGAWAAIQSTAGQAFSALAATVGGIWSGITGAIRAEAAALVQGVTGAWTALQSGAAAAFYALAGTLSGVWAGITGTVRSAVNGVIGFLNGLISGLASGINAIASALNSLHIDIPAWVPKYGGGRLGFNLPYISLPHIPYLAQGAVIPANREFLAVLGDQRRGTNVEAPLEVIEQAVANVLDRNADLLTAAAEYIVAAIERKETDIHIGDEAIGRAAERYQYRQAVLKGGLV